MPILQPDDSTPAFSVLTHRGQELSLASLHGKEVFVRVHPGFY